MTHYVTLAQYFWLAEQVTGLDAMTLAKVARVDLADSAIHAPAVQAIAAHTVDEAWAANWIRSRTKLAD